MTQQLWNGLAKSFETAVCDVTASSGAQLAELVRRTGPNRGQTLVDAGCGIGSFLKRFGGRYGNVIAFDFARRMVTRAKKRCPALRDVTWKTLGLEDAAAAIGPVGDLTVCLNVITSTDAKLRRRQWASLAGLARSGGYVLVVVPALESALHVQRFAEDDNKIHGSDFKRGMVFRGDDRQKHYTRDELRKIVAREGLRVVALKRIHYAWADDGVHDPGRRRPWSWACLARRRKQSAQSG
jgi:2-polyprenyl-3-methyl-5-hydroxy-6-metoxy-1,4-benzoquinol methylase